MIPRNNGQEKKMRKGRGGMKWEVGKEEKEKKRKKAVSTRSESVLSKWTATHLLSTISCHFHKATKRVIWYHRIGLLSDSHPFSQEILGIKPVIHPIE